MENQRLIVEAAVDIIFEVGIEKLTLNAVSKRANLSKGGLLHHFPQKELLIEEIYKRQLDQFTEWIRSDLNTGTQDEITFFNVIINEYEDENQKRNLRLGVLAISSSPYYRGLYEKWDKKYFDTDAVAGDPVKMITILVATGLLTAQLLGHPDITNEQKKAAFRLFGKPEKNLNINIAISIKVFIPTLLSEVELLCVYT